MGYQIHYGRNRVVKTISEKKPEHITKSRICTLVLLAVIIMCLVIWKVEPLKKVFIPGDTQITSTAVAHLTKALKEGEPVGDAVSAFCREIIDNAIEN